MSDLYTEKKKILIVAPHIIVGGVEKALINMLEAIPKEEYDVQVRFVKKQGGFEGNLPNNVSYSEIEISEAQKQILLCGGAKATILRLIKLGKIIKACKVLVGKLRGEPFPEFLGEFSDIPKDEQKYDYAICYHMHMPFIVAYVAEKIEAKNKICWIHNDFLISNFNINNIKNYLAKYDQFYAVSQQLKQEFVERMPQMEQNCKVFYNLMNKKEILLKSEEQPEVIFLPQVVNILSVGRLNPQKGFDVAIEVAEILKNKNITFKWYIIGEGEERKKLENQIKLRGLENQVVLLGAKPNPYPYMKSCDIYVQPSRHEGYGITISEIKLFDKPIVCTDFAGAQEQLEHQQNSKIVPLNKNLIFKAICDFIQGA